MGRRDKLRERARKQHLQDESVIDHLAGNGSEGSVPGNGNVNRGAAVHEELDEKERREFQEHVRRQWTPGKGGLPDF